MGAFRERISGDQRARIGQRTWRILAQALDELPKHVAPHLTEALTLCHAPMVEAVADGQVEAVEELALQETRGLFKRVERRVLGCPRQQSPYLIHVDHDMVTNEGDALAVGAQPDDVMRRPQHRAIC